MTATAATTRDPARLLDELGEPLSLDDYDWSRARAQPLSDEETFQLTYATEVEWGTEGTFASLDISDDPVVKRFLRIWLDQEVVHAHLLARFLRAVGATAEPRHRTPRQRRAATRGKWINWVARRVVGKDFFGVHMTWGAVNELTTLRFYRLIRENTRNELLRDLLRDLMTQEAKHYTFYRTAAIRRLAGNGRGQRITRWAMEHLWSPVGVGLRTRSDADRLLLGLFDDRPDQVAQMDAQLERIPGLEGLDLVQRCLVEARAAYRGPWSSAGCTEVDGNPRSSPRARLSQVRNVRSVWT